MSPGSKPLEPLKKIARAISYKLSYLKTLYGSSSYSDQDKETIWIVGDGRSGSTWLQEMINYDDKYKCLFEPFHPTQVNEMKDMGFYKYLRPDQKDTNFHKLASRVFDGKIRHPRVIRGDKSYNPKILIKDIFANLFIKWACNNFPGVKKIFIMRHPFATALSKQKLKDWDWMTEPKQFLNQPFLVEDYLEPYREIIEKTAGDFEKQVLIWSIIHYVALKQLEERDIILVFYEDLCSDPEGELERIFAFLYGSAGERINSPKLAEKIKAPSFTSRQNSAIKRGGDLFDVWKKDLSESNIENGIEILRTFGLDRIYNRSLTPDREAAESFMKASNHK